MKHSGVSTHAIMMSCLIRGVDFVDDDVLSINRCGGTQAVDQETFGELGDM